MSDFKAVYVLNASDFPSGGGGITGSISAGTTKATLGQVVFGDSNGVSFGVNGQTVTASHNGLTAQSTQPVAASANNGSFAFSTLSFSNVNGISFGTSAGPAITASHNALTSQSNQALSGSNGSFTFETATFGNLNGLSFYTSNGSLVGSHNALTSQSNQALSGSNGSFTFQTASFGNSNGVTFYTTNGSMVASYTQDTTPPIATAVNDVASAGSTGTVTRFAPEDHRHAGVAAFGISNTGTTAGNTATRFGTWVLAASGNVTASASSGAAGVHTAWISVPNSAAQTVQTQPISAFATGNTTQSSSGTSPANSLLFRGDGIASVGVTNGSVVISVPSGGGAGFTGGMSNLGNTAGTSGTVASQIVFVGSNNITLSQSVNGNSATISISAAAGGAGATLSRWSPEMAATVAGSSVGNSSVTLVPFRIENPLAASQLFIPISVSGVTTTNNTGAGMQLSMSAILYSRNGASLSSFNSASMSISSSYSSNATASFNGLRAITAALATASTFDPGEYWMAVHVSTVTTGNTSLAKSMSMVVVPTWASGVGVANYFGQGQTNTRGVRPGLAIHSTGATRASIGFTDITGHSSNSASLANLWFALRNYTIW